MSTDRCPWRDLPLDQSRPLHWPLALWQWHGQGDRYWAGVKGIQPTTSVWRSPTPANRATNYLSVCLHARVLRCPLLLTWLSGKLPSDCQKIAKKLKFKKKKITKFFYFFQKNCHWQFFWKKYKNLSIFLKKIKNFVNVKKKMSSFFFNFLTFKWQFSGGSAINLRISS